MCPSSEEQNEVQCQIGDERTGALDSLSDTHAFRRPLVPLHLRLFVVVVAFVRPLAVIVRVMSGLIIKVLLCYGICRWRFTVRRQLGGRPSRATGGPSADGTHRPARIRRHRPSCRLRFRRAESCPRPPARAGARPRGVLGTGPRPCRGQAADGQSRVLATRRAAAPGLTLLLRQARDDRSSKMTGSSSVPSRLTEGPAKAGIVSVVVLVVVVESSSRRLDCASSWPERLRDGHRPQPAHVRGRASPEPFSPAKTTRPRPPDRHQRAGPVPG